MNSPAPLPSKEAALFKLILRQYEHKQYKKGLKVAEQILKKVPEHGETLAMKGLFLSHLDRKPEAYEFVKRGVRNHLKSPVCWHVFGLIYRSDKNYEEAMKCYRHALKYDTENIQVLRDFSFLQIQMRDYQGFRDTQLQLLNLRASQRAFWIGLAVSYHLLKNYDGAIKVIDAFLESAKDRPQGTVDYDHSEILMYKASVLEEAGRFNDLLGFLDSVKKDVCDQLAWKEFKARALLLCGRPKDSEAMYRELIEWNSENEKYYEGLFKAAGIHFKSPADQRIASLKLVQALAESYPRSHCLKKLALKYADGEEFKTLLDEYLRNALRKGVPALFNNTKSLLENKENAAVILDLIASYEACLKEQKSFSPGSKAEPPSAYLWTLFFLAQFHDRLGDFTKALEYVSLAEQHTPTLLELLMLKARIYKHAGNSQLASHFMNEARCLDLQDRFVNTKATKYMLRNQEFSTAQETIGLFLKNGDVAEKMNDLKEMQSMWFAIESGMSHLSLKHYGPALKQFRQVFKDFEDITDDQFDFHAYCFRKMTLRSYVDLLRYEDRLQAHPNFIRAAEGAVQVYLAVFDNPKLVDPNHDESMENMSASERKKLKSKLKKAAAAASQGGKEEEAKVVAPPAGTTAAASPAAVKDQDPHGHKLLQAPDLLEEALKFIRHLQMQAPHRVLTHSLSFEVYLRQKKTALAYKALVHAKRVEPESPTVHEMTIRFWQYLEGAKASTEPLVLAIIEQDRVKNPALVKGVAGLVELNEKYLDAAKLAKSVRKTVAGVKSAIVLGAKDTLELAKVLCNTHVNVKTLDTAKLVLAQLKKMNMPASSAEHEALVAQFMAECHKKFPLATLFLGSDETAALKQQVVAKDLIEKVAELAIQ